jgi:hypothetical protein
VTRLRARLIPLMAGVLLLGGATAADAATVTFVGPGTDWNAGANWDTLNVPGVNDDAVIPVGKSVVLNLGAAGSVKSLAQSGSLTVSSNTLTIGIGASSISAGLALSASTLNVNGPVTWTGGDLQLNNNNAFVNINSGGTLDAQGTQNVTLNTGNPLLHVLAGGTFKHTSGATMGVDVPVEVDGTLLNSAGTMSFGVDNNSSVTDSGTWTVTSPGVFQFYGTTTVDLVAGGSMGGSGTVRVLSGGQVQAPTGTTFSPSTLSFEGGSVVTDVNATVTTLLSPGGGGNRTGTGTFNTGTGAQAIDGVDFGGGTTNVNGPMSLTGGFRVSVGGVVNLNSTVTWTGGTIQTGNSAVLNVGSGGRLDAQGLLGITVFTGNPHFNVLAGGEFRRSSGAGITTLGLPVANAGTFDLQTGQLDVNSLTQTGGVTKVGTGTTLNGPVDLQGGTLRGLGTVSNDVTNPGGVVAPGTSPGKLTITGNYAQGPAGRLDVEIAGITQDTLYDHLAVGGTATLGGVLAILADVTFDPPDLSSYTVLTATGGVSGDFASQTGSVAGNKTYTRHVNANDVTLTVATSGPAPPSGGTPSISGTPQSGQTLTCNAGTWTGSPTSYAYQWLRDGGAIGGATAATYGLTDADVGHAITCRVVAHNTGGDSAPATSSAVTPAAAPATGGGGTTTTTTPTTTTTTTATTATTPVVQQPAAPTEPANLKAVDVVTLPSAMKCVSRRKFRIRILQPAGVKVVSATVFVKDKRVRVVKGTKLTAPVDLTGLPKGRFAVKIVVVTATGRTLTAKRLYRTCTPKRTSGGRLRL